MFRYLLTAILTLTVCSTSAMAHPGHGSAVHTDGVMHYLTSPQHAGAALIIVAIVITGRRLLGASSRDTNRRG